MEASDERQYMIHEGFEVYEKFGAPIGAATMHYHDFYEIIYVLDGEYSSLLGNRTYHMKKGDFLLINRNEMHRYHFEDTKQDSSRRIILWVTEEMLQKLSEKQMDLTACFRENETRAYHFPIYYEEMLRGYLLKLAMQEMKESNLIGAKEISDRGYLTLFFVYLNILCGKKEYLDDSTSLDSDPLVSKVDAYIEAHIGESINVDQLANAVHMSKYYFLRKFKELTGVTVHNFVIHKKMIYACTLLREEKSVLETARLCGFSEYSVFLRNFQNTIGVNPSNYRMQI